MPRLTKSEKDIVLSALLYFRDDATHEEIIEGGSEGAGLDHDSRSYKDITSAIEKLRLM